MTRVQDIRARMRPRGLVVPARYARSDCRAVFWTVLHCPRTLAITALLERAKRAVWTRIGHTRALIDRVRACVN